MAFTQFFGYRVAVVLKHFFRRAVWLVLLSVGLAAPVRAQTPPAPPAISELTIGSSAQGRPITAVRIGDGPRKFVIVGDTHGGPEANTYVLTNQLIDFFRGNPASVPQNVRLYLIPTINPDGLALGTRFDANGVDLNRNMNTDLDACPENDWRNQVEGAYGVVSNTGGPYAESEVESRLIRDFLLDASGAIFIHSNAGMVFPAFCEHQPSIMMAQMYAQGAGYLYTRFWPKYFITGGMHDWAGSMGIAAITPELVSGDDSEFAQNRDGLLAVLEHADQILLAPQDHEESGIAVPAEIWRYWRIHGGADRLGRPLAPATQDGQITRQMFERATIEIHPDQADTPDLVQSAALGRAMLPGAFPPVAPDGASRFFPETGHTLRETFLAYWERNEGMRLLGLPLSEEFEARAGDGQLRTVQYFERGALAYYPEDGSARLEPLGWYASVRASVTAPTVAQQVR
jgi:predicted deacylase